LGVEWVGRISDGDHPCIAQWLKQHGHLICHLTVEVHVSQDRLKLRQFSEAAAGCRSIDLTLSHDSIQVVDLADLEPVAGSLRRLSCGPDPMYFGTLEGASVLNSMSQLTALHLDYEDLGTKEHWSCLAQLVSLRHLSLKVGASGDPSPLSALTGLSYLCLKSLGRETDGLFPYSLSSLQPLRTLWQLEELQVKYVACAATSLQDLGGLSNLKVLDLGVEGSDEGMFRSLEGLSPGVVAVSIAYAPKLVTLAGMGSCTSMEKLSLHRCGVSSLQPLRGLSSLKQLNLSWCSVSSLKGLDIISLQSLLLNNCNFLNHLSGVEHLSSLTSLVVEHCGSVTSLQPLSQLGEGLQNELKVYACQSVCEEVLELPHVQPTAAVAMNFSRVKEVVLASSIFSTFRSPQGVVFFHVQLSWEFPTWLWSHMIMGQCELAC
jgi:hypothetical protein